MIKSIKKICLAIIVFPLFLFAQEKKTLLIIPLSKNNIRFSALAEKNIKYNNMSRDSLSDYVVLTAYAEIETAFRSYSLHYLNEYNPSGEMPDSVFCLKLYNCFYYNMRDSALENIKYKSTSLASYHNNYYGRDLTGNGLAILKNAIMSSRCNYILFLNRFEIINPNSVFSWQLEVMDNLLNRIYGNKNQVKKDISKTMFSDVLKYYIRSSCEDMIKKTQKYLENK